jgi:hypothetical protein
MKKGIKTLILLFLLTGNACRNGDRNEGVAFVADAGYIQVVLFHLTQRCESCTAVEGETQWVLENEYGQEVQAGQIKFVSLDFQTENGKKAAGLLRASGQTLYVVKGDSIADLTSAAFMYASTNPEHYREALRKTLDQYLE